MDAVGGKAGVAPGGDQSVGIVENNGIAIRRQDEAAGQVGDTAEFLPALLAGHLAKAQFIELADIVPFGLEQEVSVHVDKSLKVIDFHNGETVVVKALGLVEGGLDHPVLRLVLVAVFLGGFVPDGLEVLSVGGNADGDGRDTKKKGLCFHSAKIVICLQKSYVCRWRDAGKRAIRHAGRGARRLLATHCRRISY